VSLIEDAAVPYVADAIGEIREILEGQWDELTDEQKTSATRAAKRLLTLKAHQTAGKDVTEDLEFVKVTVQEFVGAGEISLATAFEAAFWKGVNKAADAFGTFLGGAGRVLLNGII